MDVLVKLMALYKKQGFLVKTGLYPWHFPNEHPHPSTRIPFTGISKEGSLLEFGEEYIP